MIIRESPPRAAKLYRGVHLRRYRNWTAARDVELGR